MLFFTIGSVFLLVYAAYHPGTTPAPKPPVKCSGQCRENNAPVHWNIVSPTFFHTES